MNQFVPISRRRFLKTGLVGVVLLNSAGWVYQSWRDVELEVMRPLILGCIGQAVLESVIEPGDTPALQSSVQATLATIATLPPYAQQEINQLFRLLSWQPTCWLFTGLRDWNSATPDQVKKFLQRWRHHDWRLLQSAYHALHDLILGAWYAQPNSWHRIGYPGPPTW
jgi:hypothetical protein